MELPLHLMDTALFYPGRMGLQESQALAVLKTMIGDFRTHGGVFTINWHTRSLMPERNWEEFYRELLSLLKAEKCLVRDLFQSRAVVPKRRSAQIEQVSVDGTTVNLRLTSAQGPTTPDLVVRISTMAAEGNNEEPGGKPSLRCIEAAWSGRMSLQLTL